MNLPSELPITTVEPIADDFTKVDNFDLSEIKVEVLPSGFSIFDRHFVLKRGRGEIVVIAAYTSHGKTSMLMQIAAHVAKIGPVFYFPLEGTVGALKKRILAGIAGHSAERIMRGEISKEKLEKANKEFSNRHLYICRDTNSLSTIIQTRAFEQAKRVGKPELIVVDYVQRVKPPLANIRTREISDVMDALSTLANKLSCPIIIGSQMNRGCESRGQQVAFKEGIAKYDPMMGDIAESSDIGHDADVVIFITRPEQYDGQRKGQADIVCAKNREGATFNVTMDWCAAQTMFYERGLRKIEATSEDSL